MHGKRNEKYGEGHFMKSNEKIAAASGEGTTMAQTRLSVEPIAPPLHKDPVFGLSEVDARAAGKGQFVGGSYANHAGKRSYKLYVPGAYQGQSLPLIVMLHGCSQDPDDFAAGTRMNAIAEQEKCFVLYPAQSESANGSRCWNWYEALNQRRNLGEPSIIAGLTRDIINTYHIDAGKVFIAGLSSGGAMSAIMGTTYPDLYTAIGIHSGLPYASARNLSSALAAMRHGNGAREANRASSLVLFPKRKIVPTIVFHGDRDTTVHPSNGDRIIEQSISLAVQGSTPLQNKVSPQVTVGQGKVSNGRSYTHAVHRAHDGRMIAEQWIVHGTGHAWSGGSSRGSFTDSKGPDAGREMLRFFLAHA